MDGMDIEIRQRVVVYRNKQAYLAWAFMNIMDVLHKSGVQHNDLSKANILLHFPPENHEVVYIGVCDWGMASWTGEDPTSLYGMKSKKDMEEHQKHRWWIAPELWYLLPKEVDGAPVEPRITPPKHTMQSEAYAVGKLAARIYSNDVTSPMFKGISSNLRVWNLAIDRLTHPDPNERWTIAHAVNTLKGHPYNFETPTHCYRYNI